MTNRTRRSFVTTVGTMSTLSLAGCVSSLGPSDTDDDPSANDTPSTGTSDSESDLSHLPGESIADFEDLEQWVTMVGKGDLAATDDDPYAGSQSAHLTADDETEYAGVYTTVSDGLDLGGKNLSLAVRYTGRQQLDLTLELLAPNSRNALGMRRTLTGPTDRWVRVDFGVNRVDTQPDLSDVREIRLIARRRGDDGGSIDCAVDDLRAVDRPETGAVMFVFDSTLESHHEVAFDVMQEYDYAGVEAIIPEAVGNDGRLTIDAMSELDDAGWDMAARPRTGAQFFDDFSPEKQEGLIRRTKTYLENRGFEDGAKHFVTPKNVLGPDSMDLVREYHEQAFRYGGGPNALPATDPHNLGTFSGSADVAKRFVEYAAQYKQLAVLRFEYVGDDGISERAFRDLLEHVDAQDVDVVTATDLLER